MNTFKVLVVTSAVALGSAVAIAQDVLKVDPAHYKLVTETAAVRIAKVTYGPGEKSAVHSHPDSVVVILTGGKMRFAQTDGTNQDSEMANDTAIYSPAGTHANQNMGTTKVEAVLIEFKTPAPGTAVLPASRPGLTMQVLAEGPRAVVYKNTITPTFAEPAGTTHDYDQVVIALAPAQVTLTLEGKPAKTSWARGDVVFIPRGTKHESKNTLGKEGTIAIVAIR